DRHPPRIAEADLAHEAEHVTTAPTGPQPEPEAVGGDVVGAEAVAHPRPAVEGGAVALGPAPASPARPVGGAQRDRPHLVEGDHRRAPWRPLAERDHARSLRLV